jgi:hypothetical protein
VHSIGQVEHEVEQRLLPYEEAMTLRETHSWVASHDGCGDPGRDWHGYVALSFRQTRGRPGRVFVLAAK